MHTTPGSYASKPINDALDALPIGQVSPVIKASDSFHIVKVENRRPAGPASFEEVKTRSNPCFEPRECARKTTPLSRKIKQNTLIEYVP